MKPQPVPITIVCSLCDQPWEAHGDKPTTADCIRLLKALVAQPQPLVIYRDRWYPANPTTYPQWWQTGITTPLNPSYTVSATDNTTSCTVTYLSPPDDPDMGVPAKVG